MITNSDEVEKFVKHDFFEQLMISTSNLGKKQREYRNVLFSKLKTRKETILQASYINSNNQLEEEKDELRAKIWVANGKTYRTKIARYLRLIRCHVECQENLSEEITGLKTFITNMDQQIGRMNKINYSLNQKTLSDQLCLKRKAKLMKRLSILENCLEVRMRHEGGFATENAHLRKHIVSILDTRSYFNDNYIKLVHQLNSDKKYMMDIIAFAMSMYDNCIDVYEKNEMMVMRQKREGEMRRTEMKALYRRRDANADNSAFIDCKGKGRELAELQPKEFRRRDKFRTVNRRKVTLYDSVLRKIKEFTNSSSVAEVIAKFNQQESIYYSYFNYNNEMSYHVTLLNNSVNRLYKDISNLKNENIDTLQWQIDEIARLEEKVFNQKESNETLSNIRDYNDTQVEGLLHSIEAVCKMCGMDQKPLASLVGDNTHVKLVNTKQFLKLLEMRIYNVLASVLHAEKKEKEYVNLTVRAVYKLCEPLTPLDEIVLTQQCPECAETDAQVIDEGGDLSYPHTLKQAKKKLYEKVTQPEIQYRLHSISQCRLPRSRLLTSQR